MLVKVGPSLGLLGTLIPMGSSLASLATGNLEAMAGQMIVAFTTTIIGLATGTSRTSLRPPVRAGSTNPSASSAIWPSALPANSRMRRIGRTSRDG